MIIMSTHVYISHALCHAHYHEATTQPIDFYMYLFYLSCLMMIEVHFNRSLIVKIAKDVFYIDCVICLYFNSVDWKTANWFALVTQEMGCMPWHIASTSGVANKHPWIGSVQIVVHHSLSQMVCHSFKPVLTFVQNRGYSGLASWCTMVVAYRPVWLQWRSQPCERLCLTRALVTLRTHVHTLRRCA